MTTVAPVRPRRRPWWEVMDPEQGKGSLRDLPRLLGDSLRLVWGAGRREFLLTSVLQIVSAVGVAAQLLIAKRLLEAVLGAGQTDAFASFLPELAAVIAITVALDFVSAVQGEQSRVLSELVGRRAFERVLDVATRVD